MYTGGALVFFNGDEMKKKLLILMWALGASLQSGWAIGEGNLTLDAFAHKDQVCLLWQAYGWPEEVVGFNIKRRSANNIAWELLNKSPIIPRLSEGADYSNQGLTEKQAESVRSKLREFVSSGSLKLRSSSEVIEGLQKRGMLSGDRIMLKSKYNFALALGFAYIDNDVNNLFQYEYAVYGVTADGIEIHLPLAMCVARWTGDKDESARVNLLAEKLGGNVRLSWDCQQDVCGQLNIFKWMIYRKQRPDDEWEFIHEIGAAEGQVSGSNYSWQVREDLSNSASNYYFAVAPVNKFQFELIKSIIEYVPPKLQAAEISNLEIQDSMGVRIVWDLDKDMLDQVAGFKLLRSKEGSEVFTQVGSTFPPHQLVTLDLNPPDHSELIYKVVTVDLEGNELSSGTKSIYFEGVQLPDMPANFQAVFYKENGENYVKGSWDLPSSSDTVMEYRLFDDANRKRSLLENGSESIGITNSYVWHIGNIEGNSEYTFGIQPVDSMGRRGERTLDAVAIPQLKAPTELELKAKYDGRDGNIYLAWNYPLDSSLIGFRIFLGDKMVSSEKDVTRNVRSWVLDDYPQAKGRHKCNYYIEAVYPNCSYKTKVATPVFVGTYDRTIPAPRHFNVVPKGSFKGKSWVLLSWQKVYEPKIVDQIEKYMIKVADNPDFQNAAIFQLNLCEKFYCEIPEKWVNKPLYFRCSAVGKQPKGGLFSEDLVRPDHTAWGKELTQEQIEEFAKISKENTWELRWK